MRILDTFPALTAAFDGGRFSLERWKAYMQGALPGALSLCLADMESCLASGRFTFERDFLPVLNGAADLAALNRAHDAFLDATAGLEARILARFGRAPDVDAVFYLGLCSGAGWVTEICGRTCVLVGVEKLLELGWFAPRDLRGLLYHELGHAYQAQFGVLVRPLAGGRRFLWQLFTEGVAMLFEQELAGDPDFSHQDHGGWAAWCAAHLGEMKRDFARELPMMTRENQRWFGDWVSYGGRPDAGYYLGAKFARFALQTLPFDALISLDIDEVEQMFARFLAF